MRNVIPSVLLVVAVAAGANAERFVAGAVGASVFRQSYQTVDCLTVTGIPVTVVDFTGEQVGLYIVGSLSFLVQAAADGVPIDLARYDGRLSVDVMFGVGFALPIRGPLSCILGLGPTFGFLAALPAFGSGAPYYGGASALGIGAGATLRWLLASRVYLAATVAGSLQFSTIMSVTDSLGWGIVLVPSVGVGLGL